MSHQEHMNCIDACYACATACDHCAAVCVQEVNGHAMATCIRTDIDCAEICRLAAAAMARGSPFIAQICALCAEVCEVCAGECAKHPMDHCQACAAACRRCVDECQRIAA